MLDNAKLVLARLECRGPLGEVGGGGKGGCGGVEEEKEKKDRERETEGERKVGKILLISSCRRFPSL